MPAILSVDGLLEEITEACLEKTRVRREYPSPDVSLLHFRDVTVCDVARHIVECVLEEHQLDEPTVLAVFSYERVAEGVSVQVDLKSLATILQG
jgi:hypothetical protein